MSLPRAIEPLVDFPARLRAHGFAVSPDQTMGFIEAVGLLGPRHMDDIRRAARALFAIPPERELEFEALFQAFFFGRTLAAPAVSSESEDDVDVHEASGSETEATEEEAQEAGAEAARAERLSERRFTILDEAEALARFSRLAPNRLPRRLSYRLAPAARGSGLNLRRTLRRAVRNDGEIFSLVHDRRKTRQRHIVLLIDVSGSMKELTDSSLRFAHALVRGAERCEVFTLGTRLTRVTSALAIRNREQALARVGRLVADFDGGTRIGDALQAFLDVPRFAGFTRGAAVLVLSDGLERGGPETMVDAVHRLSRIAWRLDWLTPLAADPGYRPETEALAAARPHLNSLADGATLDAVCSHVLSLARAA